MDLERWRALAFTKIAQGFVILDKPRYGKYKDRLVMTDPSTNEVIIMPVLDEIIRKLKRK